MAPDSNNLIWIDLEMTGLDPDRERIIEVATIVTDSNLEILDEGPVLAVKQADHLIDSMDDWNREHHGRSGLIDRVRASTVTEVDAAQATIEFLSRYVPAGVSPMAGNSVCQDRRFLYRWMPALESYFHYRNLDVSTLKILCQLWSPDVASGFTKNAAHVALMDIRESIDELRYYREHFLKAP